MKIALLALGLLAAGVIGGVTTDLLRSDAPVTVPRSENARLKADLDDLKTSVARLSQEVNALRDARVIPNDPASAGDPAAVPADTAAPVAAASEKELEEKVTQLIDKKDRAESEARTKRMNAMFEERDKERLEKYRKELDLTDYQAEELAKIMGERRQAMIDMRNEIFAGGAEAGTREKMRETMKKVREDSNEKVKVLLSTTQYETYEKMDTGGRGGRGGGGFGGGPR